MGSADSKSAEPTPSINTKAPTVAPSPGLDPEEAKTIATLFAVLDENQDGSIDKTEFRKKLNAMNIPANDADLQSFLETFPDKKISLAEFQEFVRKRKIELQRTFELVDKNKDGTLSKDELDDYFQQTFGEKVQDASLNSLIKLLDPNNSHGVRLSDWLEVLVFLPTDIQSVFKRWEEVEALSIGDSIPLPPKASQPHQATPPWVTFVGAGIAGGVSRTVTAPLERLKTLYQVSQNKPPSILRGFYDIYKMIVLLDCIKDILKHFFNEDETKLRTWERLASGSLAGCMTHTMLYPLGLLQTKLTIAKKGAYNSMSHVLVDAVRKEGIRGLYRGLNASLCSTIPHSAIELTTYDKTKLFFMQLLHEERAGILSILGAAGVSSFLGSIVAYPLHTVKVRLVAQRIPGHVVQYNGMFDAFKKIAAQEGTFGFYKGFLPGLLKNIPAHSITWITFEYFKKVFGVQPEKKHKKKKKSTKKH